MKFNNIVLIGVLSSFLMLQLQAQEPTELIDTFFVKLEKKDSDAALDYLFSTNEWMLNRTKDDIDNIKLQLKSIINIIGEYTGREYVTEKSVGSSLKLYSFLVKYDRQPLRFTFIFYKPKDKWMIFNFQYDQNLTDELEESAKAYRLRENFEY